MESIHSGHFTNVDSTGKLVAYAGNPKRMIFSLSSIKPLQGLSVIEIGAADHYNLSEKDIALICSSHSGEKQHAQRIKTILKKAEIRLEALKCGMHTPIAKNIYKSLILEGKPLTSVYHNCSGKHAGMLIIAKYLEEPLENIIN